MTLFHHSMRFLFMRTNISLPLLDCTEKKVLAVIDARKYW